MGRGISYSLTTDQKPRETTESVTRINLSKTPVGGEKNTLKPKHKTAPNSVALPTCSSVAASRGSGEDFSRRSAAYWKLYYPYFRTPVRH